MRKLLYIVNHSEFFISHRLPLARAAKQSGYEVHIATSDTIGVEQIKAEFEHVHLLPLNASAISLKDDIRLFMSLFSLFVKIHPTQVHCITLKAIIWGGLAGLLAGVPRMIFAVSGLGHYFGPEDGNGMMRTLIKHMVKCSTANPLSQIIVQNDSDFEFFTSGNRIHPSKFIVISGSGVDASKVIKSSAVNSSPVRVLFASRLLVSKGVLDFIESAKLVHRTIGKDYPCVFEIAGEPDYNNPNAMTTEQIEALKPYSFIRYHGHVDHMSQLFSEVSVFCLPTYYGEGVPKVLIEAMAAGLPLIASDTAGCNRVLTHSKNGVSIPVKNRKKLADAMSYLIRNPSVRSSMAENSSSMFSGDFILSNVIRKHLVIYSKGDESCAV